MRTAPFLGRNPTVRFVLAAILLIVLVASGIVLVGYTTRVGGKPTPAAGTAPSLSPSAAPVPPAVAAPPPVPAPAEVPKAPAGTPNGSAGTPKGSQPEGKVPTVPGEHGWPDNLPDPKEYENGRHGPSPFAERCRTGQIPAYLCQGFPKG